MTRRTSFLAIIAIVRTLSVAAQDSEQGVHVALSYGTNVALSVREDVRLRENGVYQGLRYREVRGVLERRPDSESVYAGLFMTLQETLRSTILEAKRVEDSARMEISLRSDGGLAAPSGRAFPRLRLVPTFPDERLHSGDEWSAPGLWVADPTRSGSPFTVLLSVAYRYVGQDVWDGKPVHAFEAGYRLRYPQEVPEELEALVDSTGFPVISGEVTEARGDHRLTILVSADGTRLHLVRDVFSNQFVLADGTTRSEEGFTLMFRRTSRPIDDVAAVAEAAESVSGAEVDRVEEGIRITLPDLRFAPDSARMLAGEREKIAAIASVILSRDGRSVLVVGHTADVGRPEGQRELSVARAKAVVESLVGAGVAPSRLLFEGRGARQPIASNDTEEGRARNRRVEIILLDDAQ